MEGNNVKMNGSDSVVLVGKKEKVFNEVSVADHIGAAAHGTSPHSHYNDQVLNEMSSNNEKQEKVRKTDDELKEVEITSDMFAATGLKRDPIVILRIDGEDLLEFINSPRFEAEMSSILSYDEIDLSDDDHNGSFQHLIVKALHRLNVDQGVPPVSDSWVMKSIIEPALEPCGIDNEFKSNSISELGTFMEEFKKVAQRVAQHLKEQPVIVAHCERTFDGNGIKRLLSNKFELDKKLEAALRAVPRDGYGEKLKEYLPMAVDVVGPSADLPPIGAVDQMDKIIKDALKVMVGNDGKSVNDEDFKRLLSEVLGCIALQLEGNPISVSANTVVKEPLASSAILLFHPSPS